MRIGATIFNQNYGDWDRYEAEEQGKSVAKRAVRSDREIFNEEIGIARMADALGFDSVWTIEHHFTPYTMVTNPLQYLTYIAGITKHVDLGTMVTVLPWHNPVRVAEDVNMLDAFLGAGRNVICGVGRGLGRREYAGLGVDQNEARGRFDESLQVLTQLLATGQCDFDGEFYKIHGLRLRPQPERDLSVNLWCAGGTEQTVEIIAKHGVRPLTIPTTSLDIALANMRRYAALRRDAGYAPSHTKLALWTYVAETTSEAQAGAEQYMVEYANSALRHYELLGTHLKSIKGYEAYGAQSDALRKDPSPFTRGFFNSHPWGTPAQTIARATELAQAFGTDEIMFIFKYGAMPMAMAEKSMRLFAKEVLPALKELNPRPLAPEERASSSTVGSTPSGATA
ncbi:MAG: LLM class flavin-dependent oxidoreductase [Candidatus Binatus sp.]|uniref:LLM class flavin-dependent oxidoreductase n=1 Tax=Candidatus Binatus sp. TaxID=2811406 RepID=UPI002728AC5B|nr:LLM class flavin-dependent oxidoreductase [Candidatus Binatus sp.]MDO8432105.1 LLM class flavin-dependent oxidoreductase [Candidatus Binatus sp.]